MEAVWCITTVGLGTCSAKAPDVLCRGHPNRRPRASGARGRRAIREGDDRRQAGGGKEAHRDRQVRGPEEPRRGEARGCPLAKLLARKRPNKGGQMSLREGQPLAEPG